MPAGLVALALGGFGIGLAEFVIAGLLPQIAASLDVSVVAAGWLISGYALSVAVGAIVLTAATTRLVRKDVLLGLVALFVLGNLLSALARNYPLMLTGRIVSALCHGSFFGIGSLVARDLVAPERKSRAVAVMFGGLTLANVLGVPFGALLGQQWGWRTTFWVITGIGLLALTGILALIPRRNRGHGVDRPGPDSSASPARLSLRQQVGAFRSVQVWLTLAATGLSYGGMFGAFSYIAYTFTDVGGFAPADVAWLLVVFGCGLVVGNLAGGRAADHDRDRTLLAALTGLTLTLTAFGLLAGSRIATVVLVFLMGFFGFASVPGMITRVTDYARGAELAASANVSASNLGNALGAWLGGLAISVGLGYSAPLYVGAVVVLSGLVVMTVSVRQTGRPAPDPEPPGSGHRPATRMRSSPPGPAEHNLD